MYFPFPAAAPRIRELSPFAGMRASNRVHLVYVGWRRTRARARASHFECTRGRQPRINPSHAFRGFNSTRRPRSAASLHAALQHNDSGWLRCAREKKTIFVHIFSGFAHASIVYTSVFAESAVDVNVNAGAVGVEEKTAADACGCDL